MEVVYASDEGYVGIMATSIASLLGNTQDIEQLRIHVIDDGIADSSRNSLSTAVIAAGAEICFIPMPDLNDLAGITLDFKDFALSTFARLWLAQIFPSLQRVMYIDCDTLICADLLDMWSIQLVDDELVAGVPDALSAANKAKVGLPSDALYVNAGVLLVDLEQWRKHKVAEEFVKFLRNNDGRVAHNDQGVINACLVGRIKPLHARYNLMSYAQGMSYAEVKRYKRPTSWIDANEFDEAKRNPTIMHATGSFLFERPWFQGSRSPMASDWNLTVNTTSWSARFPRASTPSFLLRLVRGVCRTPLRRPTLYALGILQSKFRDRFGAF